MNSLCLITVILARAARCQQRQGQFVSETCRITFAYPSDWEVVPDTLDPDTPCSFSVRPRDWQLRLAVHDSVDLYSITVRAVPHGIWSQAALTGFERRAGGWVILGRQGLEEPADTISRPGWLGIRGTASVGCFREGDGYAGLCDAPTAVVGTAERAVVLIAGPQAEDVFDRIVGTLRLRP